MMELPVSITWLRVKNSWEEGIRCDSPLWNPGSSKWDERSISALGLGGWLEYAGVGFGRNGREDFNLRGAENWNWKVKLQNRLCCY